MNSKAVLMRTLVIVGSASLLFLGGCGGSTSPSFNQSPNPTPTITTISPNSAMAGAPFTLTINGTTPGQARSIHLLISRHELPDLA